ncbi:hypothetical protein TBK1r_64780 [Stieleria magnilauensis]|uniref:Uncharacterized protein n=1 Tax=Stieleria magnilauensis TaxID=2527963 RepID=A0ABX5XZI1_9BACT|nr:hypothetical protein TBK1r_64780 [Planctomycetes bacterium TBK1r]
MSSEAYRVQMLFPRRTARAERNGKGKVVQRSRFLFPNFVKGLPPGSRRSGADVQCGPAIETGGQPPPTTNPTSPQPYAIVPHDGEITRKHTGNGG